MPLASQAQSYTNGSLNDIRREPYSSPLFNPYAAKTTTDNACRLIAMTFLHWDGIAFVPIDSSTYVYPGGRSSLVFMDNIRSGADTVDLSAYSSGTSTYTAARKTVQTFDAHDNVTGTESRIWIPWASTWRNYQKTMTTYDIIDNMLTYTWQNWDTTAGAWVNTWNYGYHYNSSNLPDSFRVQTWNPVTSSWRDNNRSAFIYNGLGHNILTLTESWDTTAANWVNAYLDTLIYSASDVLTGLLSKRWNTGTGSWQNQRNLIYTDYVDNRPGGVITQLWSTLTSSFYNSEKQLYTYNSFGQTSYSESLSWNSFSNDWERTSSTLARRYYYQTYVTAVSDATATAGKMDIFPVPAKDEMHISAAWNESQAFSVTVTDMAGRTVKTWNVPMSLEYSATVPVSNLPSGNYIVKLSGAKGSLSQQISIVR